MKPIKRSRHIEGIGLILIIAAIGFWPDRRPVASLPVVSFSTILRFTSIANGMTVELSVGVSHSCDLMSSDDCLLDQLAEVRVDGKLVSAFGVEEMSPIQNRAMRDAILAVLQQRPDQGRQI